MPLNIKQIYKEKSVCIMTANQLKEGAEITCGRQRPAPKYTSKTGQCPIQNWHNLEYCNR